MIRTRVGLALSFSILLMVDVTAAVGGRPLMPPSSQRATREESGDSRQIIIKAAWVQEGPPSQKITTAYMVIENRGSDDITLLSASTASARVVEIHEMQNQDGMMRMHKVDELRIPAGGLVELKPGAYHLMLIDLNQELKEDDSVTITLAFSKAVKKTIVVPVKKRSSMVKEEGN